MTWYRSTKLKKKQVIYNSEYFGQLVRSVPIYETWNGKNLNLEGEESTIMATIGSVCGVWTASTFILFQVKITFALPERNVNSLNYCCVIHTNHKNLICCINYSSLKQCRITRLVCFLSFSIIKY